MSRPSTLRRAYDGMAKLPPATRARLLGLIFTRVVKYAGTSGLRFDEVAPDRIAVSMKNRRKIQNHIGGPHAIAMAMIAESATGALLGLNLPAGKIPLIKRIEIDYTRRCEGGLRAVAHLSDAQIDRLQTETRGEIAVPVSVTDSVDNSPIDATMVWAWIPAKG